MFKCGFKKSQKGCCIVSKNENGEYIFTDGHTWDEASTSENQLVTIYKDGKMVREQSLADIRNLLHYGKF